MYTQTKTHRIVRIRITDHTGTHDGGEVSIHKSRNCSNCAHDGLKNSEWCAEGGVEEFGRCMNLCSVADSDCAASNWCDSHQTGVEFEANIQRPHSPVFAVVQGGLK